jgi:Tol biopolymer transport system component
MSVMASADGGRLVYGCMFPAPGSASGPRRSDLHVLNTRTGQDRVLTGVAPTPLRSISADGRFLIYVAPRQTAPELLMMDLDTGTSWPVAPGWPRDLSMANLRWAPDGSFVLIDGSSTGTSTKLFEGVTYDAITKQVTTKK